MNAIPKPPARPLYQAEYGHFIGGEWVGGSSGRKISLQNPAHQSHLAYIQAGSAADANVDNRMRIAQEEIFGPVSTVLKWSDEAEMLERVNDTVYGLGGGVWTRDLLS
jgi:acyl-CoA reductase-like NAD-dependent aldehyde dehydrogenase